MVHREWFRFHAISPSSVVSRPRVSCEGLAPGFEDNAPGQRCVRTWLIRPRIVSIRRSRSTAAAGDHQGALSAQIIVRRGERPGAVSRRPVVSNHHPVVLAEWFHDDEGSSPCSDTRRDDTALCPACCQRGRASGSVVPMAAGLSRCDHHIVAWRSRLRRGDWPAEHVAPVSAGWSRNAAHRFAEPGQVRAGLALYSAAMICRSIPAAP